MAPDPRVLRSDTPITGLDEDKYQRSATAKLLARRFARYQGPKALTVGVCGPWGSGKSSFVNLVVEALKEAPRAEGKVLGPVVLSPWALAKADNLAAELLIQIGRTLSIEHQHAKTSAAVATEVGTQIIELGASLYVSTLDPTSPVGLLGATLGALPAVRSIAKPLLDRIAREPTISERKGRISKALMKSNNVLIVALDDLERLPSDRIQEVFRVVGAIGEFANTVYLLSMDRHRVAKALDGAFVDGHEYLEKFLNLAFDLPTPDPDVIKAVVKGRFEDALRGADYPGGVWDSFEELWDKGLNRLIDTPRDVERLMNSFGVALEAVGDETHPADLLALEALRVTLPGVHRELGLNPVAVLRGQGDLRAMFLKEKTAAEASERLEAILGGVKQDVRPAVTALLGLLFPLTGNGGGFDETQAYRQRRATSPDHFDNYFRWTLAVGAITEREVLKQLNALCRIGSDEAARAWVQENGDRFGTLGEKLRHFLPDLASAEARWDFAAGILRVAHLLSEEVLPQRLAYQAIKGGDERTLRTWHEELWRRCCDSEMLYGIAWKFAVRLDEREGDPNNLGVAPESVRADVSARLEEIVTQGKLEAYPKLGALLFRWRDVAGSDEAPRRYVADLLRDDRADVVWRLLASCVVRALPLDRRFAGTGVPDPTLTAEQLRYLFDLKPLSAFVEQHPTPDPELADTIRQVLAVWAEWGERPDELLRRVLDVIIVRYVDTGSDVRGRDVRMTLSHLKPGAIDYALDRLRSARYIESRGQDLHRPTLQAVLAVREPARDLLEALLGVLRQHLRLPGDLRQFNWETDFRQPLNRSPDDWKLAMALVRIGHLCDQIGGGDDNFWFSAPADHEALARTTSLDDVLHRAMRLSAR